jgi:hypothetical protein
MAFLRAVLEDGERKRITTAPCPAGTRLGPRRERKARMTSPVRQARSAGRGRGRLLLAGGLLLGACGGPPTEGDGTTPGWGQAEILAEPAVFDSPVGVSLDGDGQGNAVAVWAPATETYAPVRACRYSATAGWRAVETIAPAGSGSVGTPTVQMNKRGDVVAIWDGGGGLRASTSIAGGAWQSPALLGDPAAEMWSWGLDDEGAALVVWLAGGGVFARHLDPRSGWGQAALVPGAESHASLQAPRVAVSGSGNALVVWARGESLGADQELWANSFDPRLGWGASHRLAPEQSSARASGATAFVNAQGDGLACWYEYDTGAAGSGVLFASRYSRAAGFGPAEALGPSAGSAIAAAIDAAGNVLVIYESGQGLRRQRYGAGGGWQAPEPLEATTPCRSTTRGAAGSSGTRESTRAPCRSGRAGWRPAWPRGRSSRSLRPSPDTRGSGARPSTRAAASSPPGSSGSRPSAPPNTTRSSPTASARTERYSGFNPLRSAPGGCRRGAAGGRPSPRRGHGR